ncbi:MAG: precorrin-3B C(17)-methyltransferase [Oscillospiraceae bacterium]|jgi:precorrin-3B C17-methyltransferase|nr:precorrin-3B C(17)-methyltransferase [Oscillospiraceae bacterium]
MLYVIGIGPGGERSMTAECRAALDLADVIVGYTVYVELIRPLYPNARTLDTAMTQEVERVRSALELAERGETVALVCSGDSGVYGMAGLALELAPEFPSVTIEVVPGVTAALSGAAALGAPLTHDFAVISLSDLLTPWELIAKRLRCAAEGDFAIALYNPSSAKRRDYLARACGILMEHKSPETPCGVVRNIGRIGETSALMTLAELRSTAVDMFTTVFIGNSQTRVISGKLVTPRGYRV